MLSTISVLKLSDTEKTVMLGVIHLQVSCSYVEMVLLSLWHFITCCKHCSVPWHSKAHHGLFLMCQWSPLIPERLTTTSSSPFCAGLCTGKPAGYWNTHRKLHLLLQRLHSANSTLLQSFNTFREFRKLGCLKGLLDAVRCHGEMVPPLDIDVAPVGPMESPKSGRNYHLPWKGAHLKALPDQKDLPVSVWHLLLNRLIFSK